MEVQSVIFCLWGPELLETTYRCFARSLWGIWYKTGNVQVLPRSYMHTHTYTYVRWHVGGLQNRKQIYRKPKHKLFLHWLPVCLMCRPFLHPAFYHFEGWNPNFPSRCANAKCTTSNMRLPAISGSKKGKIILLPLVHTSVICVLNTAAVSFQFIVFRWGCL